MQVNLMLVKEELTFHRNICHVNPIICLLYNIWIVCVGCLYVSLHAGLREHPKRADSRS